MGPSGGSAATSSRCSCPAPGAREARAAARRLGDALATRAPASLGAAALPADGREREELHHQADVRLYAVKHGRSAVQVPARRRELSWAAALAAAVDRRVDGGAHPHSQAVADLAVAIGRRLGWAEARLAQLRVAAILHDVGKVALPDDLLGKEGALTDEELAVARSHAALGAELVGASRASSRSSPGCATCTSASTGPATRAAWPARRSRSSRASSRWPTPGTP